MEPNESQTVELAPTNGHNLALSFDNLALSVLSQRQFEILTEKVPAYALKKREDGYTYVASGWIKKKLFEAFGMDWDWQIIPIEGAQLYSLKERDEGKKIVQYVAVSGVLTVRVRNPKTLEVISTITKFGVGSQVWRAKMELGDAIKGAKTDALRNAAFDLGIGFNYKWDDELEQQRYEDAQNILNGIPKLNVDKDPAIGEFPMWIVRVTGIPVFDDALQAVGIKDMAEVITDLAKAIEKVKNYVSSNRTAG